jgi:hypothetical protein
MLELLLNDWIVELPPDEALDLENRVLWIPCRLIGRCVADESLLRG